MSAAADCGHGRDRSRSEPALATPRCVDRQGGGRRSPQPSPRGARRTPPPGKRPSGSRGVRGAGAGRGGRGDHRAARARARRRGLRPTHGALQGARGRRALSRAGASQLLGHRLARRGPGGGATGPSERGLRARGRPGPLPRYPPSPAAPPSRADAGGGAPHDAEVARRQAGSTGLRAPGGFGRPRRRPARNPPAAAGAACAAPGRTLLGARAVAAAARHDRHCTRCGRCRSRRDDAAGGTLEHRRALAHDPGRARRARGWAYHSAAALLLGAQSRDGPRADGVRESRRAVDERLLGDAGWRRSCGGCLATCCATCSPRTPSRGGTSSSARRSRSAMRAGRGPSTTSSSRAERALPIAKLSVRGRRPTTSRARVQERRRRRRPAERRGSRPRQRRSALLLRCGHRPG